MFNLFKLNKKNPAFDTLNNYEFADRYFRRIATWMWLNKEMIHVIDNHAPRFITMDPWPQKIFLAANGQKTIREYVYEVAGEYRGKIPERLDRQIIHDIGTLVKEKVIELLDEKRRPEPAHDSALTISKPH